MKVRQTVKKWAEAPLIKQYDKARENLQGSYSEWLPGHECGPEAIGSFFAEHPEVLILYGDEDEVLQDGSFGNPWFKPDWSPETMESCFYTGSLTAVRRVFLEEALPDWEQQFGEWILSGGTVPSSGEVILLCNEAPDEGYRERIVSLFRRAGGWEKGCSSIAHLPMIVHHSTGKLSAGPFAGTAGTARASESLGTFPEGSFLSVIIPSKDHPELLGKCLSSLEKAVSAKGRISYEVIVVDNGSSDENRRILEGMEGICYLYEPMEFDFARMCNLGAKSARGDFYLFLNDDVEILPESHPEEMMALAARPGVGSVGIKLYYPTSVKLQHAGIVNLPMGPVHKLQFLEDSEEYYFGMNRGLRNVLAVTAACMMLRADRFREAGGFDETLKVAFNDVALGFRLYELGYRNVCMCDSYAYHHESLTRGSDEDSEKLARLLRERARLGQLFPKLEGRDPYYSPNLGWQGLDVRVRPAYVTANNRMQEGGPLPEKSLGEAREDNCLLLRVEDERDGEITGYLLVLGDDNACYERRLVLRSETGEDYTIPLGEVFRPDLEENLPDQIHVGLSGFWVKVDKDWLAAGKYRIGGLAIRKVGKLRLLNWSNRYLYV